MTPSYREHDPDPALAAHVHCSWTFAAHEDGAEQAIPPDGRAELIVHRGRPYDERCADGSWQTQPALLVAGQLTRPLVLRSRGEVDVLAVRFTPAGAWAFAGVPMAMLTDRRVALGALHGERAVHALGAALDAASAAAERLAILGDYVSRQIALRGPGPLHLHAGTGELFTLRGETADLPGFLRKGAHHPHAIQRFMQNGIDQAPLAEEAVQDAPDARPEYACQVGDERRGDQHQQCQLPVQVEKHACDAHHHEEVARQVLRAPDEELL
jgi:hypothetical protein